MSKMMLWQLWHAHQLHGMMQVEELDAEIKHAFADLEHKEWERQELQAKSDELAAQLSGAEQHMEDLMARLNSKAIELEELQAHHNKVKVEWHKSALPLPCTKWSPACRVP